jgi:hypothetical protein
MGRINPQPNIPRPVGTAETSSDDEKMTLSNLQEKPVLWYKVSNVFLFFVIQIIFKFISYFARP